MADCCQQLQAQLNELQAQVSALSGNNSNFLLKSDRSSIVQQSITGSYDLIFPLIGFAISKALSPVFEELASLGGLVNLLKGQIGALIARLAPLTEVVIGTLLELAAAATAILGLVAAIADLMILGNNISAVESEVLRLGQDVSNILGSLLGIKQLAQKAENDAQGAYGAARDANSLARTAISNGIQAETDAAVAGNKADAATRAANQAVATANNAITRANLAESDAQSAIAKANNAEFTANKATSLAINATNSATQAKTEAESAYSQASAAIQSATKAESDAQTAFGKATTAQNTADTAIGKVTALASDVSKAIAIATDAASKANDAVSKATNALDSASKALSTANDALNEAKKAEMDSQLILDKLNSLGGQISAIPLATSNVITPQIYTTVNTVVGNAEKQIVDTVERDIINKNTTTSTSSNSQVQSLQQISDKFSNFENSITAKLTQVQGGLTDIQSKVASPTTSPIGTGTGTDAAVAGALTQIKQAQTQQTNQLNQIQATVANPPSIDVKPLVPQLVDPIKASIAVATATVLTQLAKNPALTTASTLQGICQSVQPGGCIGNGLNNLGNNLQNALNSPLAKIADQLNQIGQTTGIIRILAIVQQTQQTLSAFTTRFESFVKWTQIDKAVNLVNFALNVQQSYFLAENLTLVMEQLTSNTLAVFGFTDDKGQPLNINQILGTATNDALTYVIGVDNVNTFKTEWKALNRIFSTASNLLFAVQNIGFSITNALNTIGSWNSQVANALKKYGVVGHNAYGWFNPSPNFQSKFFTATSELVNAANSLGIVAQSILQGRQAIDTVEKQSSDLVNDLKTATHFELQAPGNDTLLGQFLQSQTDSASPSPTPEDIYSLDDL